MMRHLLSSGHWSFFFLQLHSFYGAVLLLLRIFLSWLLMMLPMFGMQLYFNLPYLTPQQHIYIYLLKTELRMLDFQHFHWLAGHRLSAHIPALPNMVNESIKKESWIKKNSLETGGH